MFYVNEIFEEISNHTGLFFLDILISAHLILGLDDISNEVLNLFNFSASLKMPILTKMLGSTYILLRIGFLIWEKTPVKEWILNKFKKEK